jgi:hypothetical protein
VIVESEICLAENPFSCFFAIHFLRIPVGSEEVEQTIETTLPSSFASFAPWRHWNDQ